jgi:ABC-type uncharacterized transport system involved in gliding motility auxiliary subunit
MAARRTSPSLGVLALVLGFIALLGINLWAGQGLSRYRADMTQGNIFTLSDATRSVLASLDEPVTVRLFHTPRLNEAVPAYARHFDRVQSMLRHYQDLAGGKLKLSLVKVDRFTDEEDEASAFGLQAAPLPGGDGSAYFGVAGTNSTDDVETLPFLAVERQDFLELDLTSLIFKLNNTGKKKVALLSRSADCRKRQSANRPAHSRRGRCSTSCASSSTSTCLRPRSTLCPAMLICC